MVHFDDVTDRKLLNYKFLEQKKVYGKDPEPVEEIYDEVETEAEANLISSECKDGWHAPVLDFDYPIQVYPSSQLGHNHLYLGKKTSWVAYQQVLAALKAADLIEEGYADASTAKGFSAVRPVGVVKTSAPSGVEILTENAQLRKENYALKQERAYLLSLVKDYVKADLIQQP